MPTSKASSDSTSSDPIHPSWPDSLREELKVSYMIELKKFLTRELERGKTIYPYGPDIFKALSVTPFSDLKVVIIGQDPYHGSGQAHGLSFSVRPGVPPPPSLINIFKEQQTDLGLPLPSHGHLLSWARQGVLLLNNVLTVEAKTPGSHRGKGWEKFTDKVVALINELKENVIFLLWGSQAQSKGSVVDPLRHHILKAPHPSPLSAHRGFFGCRHFSKANQILSASGRTPIDWALLDSPL
ncbi:MAG: uracil-DNA glycosylase [Bacteriovoracales bacterium]|nr:uracil-DNA glycosylase [Bacteriovoracales bacterium]